MVEWKWCREGGGVELVEKRWLRKGGGGEVVKKGGKAGKKVVEERW